MVKKISFIIIINIILLFLIELSVRFVLDYFNYPKVYKISNIDNNRYDFQVIEETIICKLIAYESPLVKLVLISLAKKLEIINGIRSIDHHNKLKAEGLII